MPKHPKTRDDDARGNPGVAGVHGNPPHERDDQVGVLVEKLSGYGMAQREIEDTVRKTFGPGYSLSTLQRHYREELDRGLSIAKEKLLKRAHQVALMENVPSGVSPDIAYNAAWRQGNWLLGTIHGMKETTSHEHTGKDGGPIQTEQVNADAEAFLSRISGLAKRAGEDEGTGEADA